MEKFTWNWKRKLYLFICCYLFVRLFVCTYKIQISLRRKFDENSFQKYFIGKVLFYLFNFSLFHSFLLYLSVYFVLYFNFNFFAFLALIIYYNCQESFLPFFCSFTNSFFVFNRFISLFYLYYYFMEKLWNFYKFAYYWWNSITIIFLLILWMVLKNINNKRCFSLFSIISYFCFIYRSWLLLILTKESNLFMKFYSKKWKKPKM